MIQHIGYFGPLDVAGRIKTAVVAQSITQGAGVEGGGISHTGLHRQHGKSGDHIASLCHGNAAASQSFLSPAGIVFFPVYIGQGGCIHDLERHV